MVKICIFAASLLLTWSAVYAFDCVHRDFGHGGTVCVCNATYCDDFKPLEKTAKGVITSYVSSQSGDRFKKNSSPLHFTSQASTDPAVTVSVSLDPNRKYQKIIGFGGSFTDSAGINIGDLPKAMQERLIRDYFASDGLEYTLGRIPIGGSDFSTRPYSYHEVPDDDNLTKFALQPEDFNYKIPYLLLAQQVSPHHVRYFGSPWSSPSWIKDNHNLSHGGFIIGQPGGRYYKIFARYFVKFLQEYTKHKVNIWGVTVENEPRAGPQKDYEFNSLGFNGTLQRDFLKLDLGPELAANGYTKDKLKVMIFDDTVPGMDEFINPILSDPEAAKYVAGVAFHWYVPSDRVELSKLHQRFPDYFILFTEASELSRPRLGYWGLFDNYAEDIIKDLNNYAAGWTDWNMALDPMGEPRWNSPKTGLDSPIIVNKTSHEYYKNPMFYALGHFTKFLQPDSQRIHFDASNPDPKNVFITVFERPDKGNVVIVLNKNKTPVGVQLHDPNQGYVTINVKAQSLETLLYY